MTTPRTGAASSWAPTPDPGHHRTPGSPHPPSGLKTSCSQLRLSSLTIKSSRNLPSTNPPMGHALKDLEILQKGKMENHQPLRQAGEAPLQSDRGSSAQVRPGTPTPPPTLKGQSSPQGSSVQGCTGSPRNKPPSLDSEGFKTTGSGRWRHWRKRCRR